MIELNQEQKKIVEAKENYVLVASCAGSGKTRCLISRYQYLVDHGVAPDKIVMITFTNAAADEISERLGRPKGVFIGTVHSYANYLLLSYSQDTSDLLENEQFDRLFERVKKHPNCVKEVEHLLLDEGQDSTELQFEFMFDMIKPKNWMVFADWRQSLYRWNGAYPEQIIDLSHRTDVKVYDLAGNYRNGYKILDFARGIINAAGYDYYDRSRPMRGVAGKVVDVEYSPIAVARAIKAMGDYKNWFVLTRTNDQLDEISFFLKKEGIPIDTFKRSELDNKELGEKMKQDTVKVLTIHTAKGLEASNVVVIGAKFFNTEERCVSYVAATRAKNLLVWAKVPNRAKRVQKLSSWEI
jgi:superfamily I DNA/RNA helicase